VRSWGEASSQVSNTHLVLLARRFIDRLRYLGLSFGDIPNLAYAFKRIFGAYMYLTSANAYPSILQSYTSIPPFHTLPKSPQEGLKVHQKSLCRALVGTISTDASTS
jgi:hypothetical protein